MDKNDKHLFSIEIPLDRLLNRVYNSTYRIVAGGDNLTSKGYLIPLVDLVKILKPKHTIVVFQPHRYSRFGFLYNNFKRILKNCDKLIVADVYPAGEKKINYLSKEKFAKDINKIKKNLAIPLNKKSELPKIIKDNTKFGDLVIFLGAGDISKWAYDLPLQIKRKK